MYNILNIITAFILIVNAKDDYCAKTWYFHNGADYPAVSVFCAGILLGYESEKIQYYGFCIGKNHSQANGNGTAGKPESYRIG
jgi:hypothetical protein